MRKYFLSKPRNGPRLIVIAVCVAIFLCSFLLVLPPAAAEENVSDGQYTGVLENLRKDESFSEASYPVIEGDYTLQVIQIAESKKGELFVYVYQPASDRVVASSISISDKPSGSTDFCPMLYWLDEIDHTETIYKYLVRGFKVSDEEERHYVIPEIFRWANTDIDDPFDQDTGNEVTEYASKVSKMWTVRTEDGSVTYECLDDLTVPVDKKYVGYFDRESQQSGSLLKSRSYSFFIAFKTDVIMDKVYEADVSFNIVSYSLFTGLFKDHNDYFLLNCSSILNGSCNHGDELSLRGRHAHNYDIPISDGRLYGYRTPDQTVTVSCEDKNVSSSGGSWFFGIGKKYFSWKSIVPTNEFLKANTDLKSDVKNNIKNMDWVITFWSHTEDERTSHTPPHYYPDSSAILRLNFIAEGKVYNVGVIDDKVTDYFKSNVDPHSWSILTWVILIAICIVLILFLPFIIKGIVWFVQWIIGLFVGGDDV